MGRAQLQVQASDIPSQSRASRLGFIPEAMKLNSRNVIGIRRRAPFSATRGLTHLLTL